MPLKLDPEFSVAFPCPQCDFVARGPGLLEDHMNEHGVVLESVAAVSVDEIAGPITKELKVVKSPRVYRCSACGERVERFNKFLEHRKGHAPEPVPSPPKPSFVQRATAFLKGNEN